MKDKVERKAFSTIEFECLLKQTDGSKNGRTAESGYQSAFEGEKGEVVRTAGERQRPFSDHEI